MNQFREHLNRAAQEARAYRPSHNYLNTYDPDWIERLALQLEDAAELTDLHSVVLKMKTIAHTVVDCGPLESNFIPSFYKAYHASQHYSKRS